MFLTSTQPSLVSLFSSTGSDPLQIFSIHTDPGLPSDSIIHLLHDSSSCPEPPAPGTLIKAPTLDRWAGEEARVEDDGGLVGYCLDQTVLHIQSPTLPTTYIRCPPTSYHLGMKPPWIHMQVRNMGREWSFEVGLVDQLGRQGVVRCSTFQKQPRLKLTTALPLLHLPLSFPSPSSYPLTAWSTIALHLPPLLSQFSSLALTVSDHEDEEEIDRRSGVVIPGGVYSHVSYIKVYATCRLRRIWFSEGSSAQQKNPWEFELYKNK